MENTNILYKIDDSINLEELILKLAKEQIGDKIRLGQEYSLFTISYTNKIVDFINGMQFYALYAEYHNSIGNKEEYQANCDIIDGYFKKLLLYYLKDDNNVSREFCKKTIKKEFNKIYASLEENYKEEKDAISYVEGVNIPKSEWLKLMTDSTNRLENIMNDFIKSKLDD